MPYLAVNIREYPLLLGGIRAKEIVMEGGWADFVFEDGYPLKSISEVAQYLRCDELFFMQ
jgi:hypothetical protein